MSLLVCDPDTGEFYKIPGMWVQSVREATAFTDVRSLIRECNQIGRVNLALFTLDDREQLRSGVRLGRDAGANRARICAG
jgi:hypothetical protein